MKVLLVNTNNEHSPWPVVPLGMSYVATLLERNGHQVQICDLCFQKNPARNLHRMIGVTKPDAIGLSIRNLDNVNVCSPIFFLEDIKNSLLAACRAFPEIPVIIGGSAVGIAPQEVMTYLEVEFAVAGDGGEAMLQWLSWLEGGNRQSLPADNAFFARQPDGTIVEPATILAEPFLDGFHPEPYRWIDYQRYQRGGATMNVQAKRGCAFNCLYCSYNVIEGRSYRLRDVGDVADEIENWLRQGPVRGFEFVDSVFNSPQSHAVALCEELIRRNVRTKLTTMGLNPGCLSTELLDVMKRAGFDDFMCSPDSASPAMLSSLRKNFQRRDLDQAASLFQRYDMRTFWFFILGGPGETRETIRETLDFCEHQVHPLDVIHITIGFRVFPGTGLAAQLRSEGYLDTDADLVQPAYFCSPHISPGEILATIHEYSSRTNTIITYFDMEIYDFFRRLNQVLFLGNPPQHTWRKAPNLNQLLNRLGIWDSLHRRHRRRFKDVLDNSKLMLTGSW